MDYMTGINTSYADTYDKTSSDLTDKITVPHHPCNVLLLQ